MLAQPTVQAKLLGPPAQTLKFKKPVWWPRSTGACGSAIIIRDVPCLPSLYSANPLVTVVFGWSEQDQTFPVKVITAPAELIALMSSLDVVPSHQLLVGLVPLPRWSFTPALNRSVASP
jgi:hypothetical protein